MRENISHQVFYVGIGQKQNDDKERTIMKNYENI